MLRVSVFDSVTQIRGLSLERLVPGAYKSMCK